MGSDPTRRYRLAKEMLLIVCRSIECLLGTIARCRKLTMTAACPLNLGNQPGDAARARLARRLRCSSTPTAVKQWTGVMMTVERSLQMCRGIEKDAPRRSVALLSARKNLRALPSSTRRGKSSRGSVLRHPVVRRDFSNARPPNVDAPPRALPPTCVYAPTGQHQKHV